MERSIGSTPKRLLRFLALDRTRLGFVRRQHSERNTVTTNMQHYRSILHVDLDAFYAAIEQRDRPELRGLPVVVGGDPHKRGVVSTCSYEARKFGLHSAMPSRTAYKLCPQAIFLPPRFEVYRTVSTQIMAIFKAHTDLVEPLSLDEAYLDVTTQAGDLTSATQLAQDIKQDIFATTGLTASAGISYSKFLAKLASDHHKPDGLTVISREQAASFLDATAIEKFLGVGKVTAARLRDMGILTGADLKRLSEEELRLHFGKYGSQLYHYARGEDDRSVQSTRVRKSVGKEETFQQDLSDHDLMLAVLERLAQQVEDHLASLRIGGKTITLKVKTSDFQLITRSKTLARSIQDAQAMLPHLRTMLFQLDLRQKPVRLLGVMLSNLAPRSTTERDQMVIWTSLWESD